MRTDGDPSALAPAVRAVVAALEPRLAVYDVRPMDTYVHAARSTRRFTMLLAAAFAVSALALTCVGVYGVLAYAVAHRRHEFGVRRALGADAGQVMREVLREGLGFAAGGCIGGLAAAAVAARLLESQLYAVHPRDPITYGTAVSLILCGAVVACWIPAHRATTISPMDALPDRLSAAGRPTTKESHRQSEKEHKPQTEHRKNKDKNKAPEQGTRRTRDTEQRQESYAAGPS